MKKSQSRSDLQSEAGKPCFGAPAESSAASAVKLVETGVFKLETEGVSRTVASSVLQPPEIGAWLDGFVPPSIETLESVAESDQYPRPAAEGSFLIQRQESVIGRDDRLRIPDSSLNLFPYRAICKLLIKSKTGKSFMGTGWIGGRNIVYTAGHCTYMQNEGGLVSSIEVLPGYSVSRGALRSLRAVNWGCTSEWAQRADAALDFGCIFIREGLQDLGKFGFDHPYGTDEQLMSLRLHIVGYPFDREGGGAQYGDARQLSRVYPNQLRYAIDTAGGQSGAPVFTSDGWVVGIHNYGGAENLATRINPSVKRTLFTWLQRSQGG
ncbi:MAG: trypsin-like serine peptidase [Planctomycetaceae bacterium]